MPRGRTLCGRRAGGQIPDRRAPPAPVDHGDCPWSPSTQGCCPRPRRAVHGHRPAARETVGVQTQPTTLPSAQCTAAVRDSTREGRRDEGRLRSSDTKTGILSALWAYPDCGADEGFSAPGVGIPRSCERLMRRLTASRLPRREPRVSSMPSISPCQPSSSAR